MKKLVLLSRLFDEGRALLEGKVQLEEHFCDDPMQRLDAIKDADGIILGNQKLGASVIEQCPKLRLIAKQGSGFDNIDIAGATKRGIPVVISAGINAEAVAEHVMMLMLATSRRLHKYDLAVRGGNFAQRSTCEELELRGKLLGLIGYGKIGRAVASFASAFGMRISVFDPYFSAQDAANEHVLRFETIQELLEQSDVVSVHVPLTNETRGLLGAAQIERMKQDAILVNCARGGIVDETALYNASASGRVFGAGIDVYAQEPASAESPLFTLEQVVATPHSAALTRESSAAMSRMTAEGILHVLAGEKWTCVANPDVYNIDN